MNNVQITTRVVSAISWGSPRFTWWCLASSCNCLWLIFAHQHHSWAPTSYLTLLICSTWGVYCLTVAILWTCNQILASRSETSCRHSCCVVKFLNFFSDSCSSHKTIFFFILLELASPILNKVSLTISKARSTIILSLVWGIIAIFSRFHCTRICRGWIVQHIACIGSSSLLAFRTHNLLSIALCTSNLLTLRLRSPIWCSSCLSNVSETRLSSTLGLGLGSSAGTMPFDIARNADGCWCVHHLFDIWIEYTAWARLPNFSSLILWRIHAIKLMLLATFRIWTTRKSIDTLRLLTLVVVSLSRLKVSILVWWLTLVGCADPCSTDGRWRRLQIRLIYVEERKDIRETFAERNLPWR